MDARKKPLKYVQWFEPRWSYIPRWNKESRELLKPTMWLRVLLVVALLLIWLIPWLTKKFPDLDVNWMSLIAQGFGVFACFLTIMYILYAVIPPLITVQPKGLTISHGQSRRFYPLEEVEKVTINVHEPSRMVLDVKVRDKVRRIGLSPNVDLQALKSFFGDKLRESSSDS